MAYKNPSAMLAVITYAVTRMHGQLHKSQSMSSSTLHVGRIEGQPCTAHGSSSWCVQNLQALWPEVMPSKGILTYSFKRTGVADVLEELR